MGSIQKKVDSQTDLTVYTVVGKITAKQVKVAIQKFYDGDITSKVLWDLSKSDVGDLTESEIESVALTPRKFAEARSGGKTAIVAPRVLSFGLARMYELQTNIQDFPFKTQTFHTTEEAYQWLLETE